MASTMLSGDFQGKRPECFNKNPSFLPGGEVRADAKNNWFSILRTTIYKFLRQLPEHFQIISRIELVQVQLCSFACLLFHLHHLFSLALDGSKNYQ